MKKALALLALLSAFAAPVHGQAVIVPSPVPALTNNCTLKWQTATSTWVCAAASATAQPLTDSLGLIADDADPTKILNMQLSGLTTATTRTWTVPDANLTFPTTIASLGTNTMTGLQTLNGGVAATTGAFSSVVSMDGGLTMDTDKFTVADATGNTVIGGTLNVTGATVFTGLVTPSSDIKWANNTGYGLKGSDDVRFLSYTTAGGLAATATSFSGRIMTLLSGAAITPDANMAGVFQRSATGHGSIVAIIGPTDGASQLSFGDTADFDIGRINYDHTTNAMTFYTNDALRGTITSAGVLDWAGAITSGGNITFAQTASAASRVLGNRTDAQVSISGGSAGATIQLFGSTFTNYAGAVFLDSGTSSGGTNDGDFVFRPQGTEKMRLSRTGLLAVGGFGTHSFDAGGTGYNALSVRNPTAGTNNRAYVEVWTDTGGGDVALWSMSSTFTTSGPFVQAGSLINAAGSGGLSVAASHASGAIRFYAGGATLRGTINSAGSWYIGGATDAYSARTEGLHIFSSQQTSEGLIITPYSNVSSGIFAQFNNATPVAQGSITATNSTTTAYNTSSDVRLKRDLGVVFATNVLARTIIHDFEWIPNGVLARGVFAQEAVSVNPAAISVGTDERDAHGNLVKPWMADYSKYVPDLIVGWQDHDRRLAALEAELKTFREKR